MAKLPWYKRFAERERKAGRNRLIYDREEKDIYLERFYLIPRKWTLELFHVHVHKFHQSDKIEDGLHDHPWVWFTYILEGGYKEHLANGKVNLRKAGNFCFARAKKLHRVELLPGIGETWTLFIVGPRIREWGFLIDGKWYHWEKWLKIRMQGQKK